MAAKNRLCCTIEVQNRGCAKEAHCQMLGALVIGDSQQEANLYLERFKLNLDLNHFHFMIVKN